MSYHLYSEREPSEKCPYCGSDMYADWVDVGVAMQQCGPYHCTNCGASEIGPERIKDGFDKTVSEEELITGYYKAKISPLANQVNGVLIDHKTAEMLYKHGLGSLLKLKRDS